MIKMKRKIPEPEDMFTVEEQDEVLLSLENTTEFFKEFEEDEPE